MVLVWAARVLNDNASVLSRNPSLMLAVVHTASIVSYQSLISVLLHFVSINSMLNRIWNSICRLAYFYVESVWSGYCLSSLNWSMRLPGRRWHLELFTFFIICSVGNFLCLLAGFSHSMCNMVLLTCKMLGSRAILRCDTSVAYTRPEWRTSRFVSFSFSAIGHGGRQ